MRVFIIFFQVSWSCVRIKFRKICPNLSGTSQIYPCLFINQLVLFECTQPESINNINSETKIEILDTPLQTKYLQYHSPSANKTANSFDFITGTD